MFGNGDFSEVFVLEVGVDLSLLSVLVVLKFELSAEGLSVLIALGFEGSEVIDLLLNGGEVLVGVVDGALEVSILGVKLIDTLFVLLLLVLLAGSGVIEGINNGASEFVEFSNDLSEGTLIGEVLLGGKGDKGLDESGVLSVGLDLSLDLLEGDVEFLDLNKGWVAEVGKEGKGIIDSSGGTVELRDEVFEFFVLLVTEEGGLINSLAVLSLVLLELTNLVLKLGSAGLKEVFDGIISALDIDLSILNVLLQ